MIRLLRLRDTKGPPTRWAACLVVLLAASSPSGSQRALPADPPPPTLRVDARAFAGLGRLAIVGVNRLYVLDGVTGELRQFRSPGPLTTPAWSADGRWLAYLRLRSTAVGVGELWVLDVNTGQTRRLDEARHIRRGGFGWSPTRDVLGVVSATPRGSHELLVVGPDGALTRLTRGEDVAAFPWSPDGRMVAYTATPQGPARSVVLRTVCATGGAPLLQFEAPATTGIELAAWWRTGQGVVFWLVPESSSSLAADGLQLYALPLGSGRPRPLVATLLYRDWLSWAPDGDRLLLVQGTGRQASEHKALTVCDVASGACRPLRQPAATVSVDAAWSPAGGRIAFVRAKGLSATPFRNMARLTDSRELWLAKPNGTAARVISQAGRGVAGPVWSADGPDLLYWRNVGGDRGAKFRPCRLV